MEVIKNKDGKNYELIVKGRLDTNTARDFEEVLKECIKDADSIELDLDNLEYISSSGLRTLLYASKQMMDKRFVLKKVPSEILEILEMTGFTRILTIED